MSYYITYSKNRLELATPGWNVWKIKPNNRQASYKIIEIIIGGLKRPDAINVSIADPHFICEDERQVISLFFELSGEI